MSYPPGNPGYPPSQQPTQYAQAPQYGAPQEPVPAGPSKLPFYLNVAVVVLGLAAYLASYGPLFSSGGEYYTPTMLTIGIIAAVTAALAAGTSLLPKQKDPLALVAVLAVLGALLNILIVISVPQDVTIAWALYLIVVFSLLQAVAAVGALLLDSGVITAPVPRPKYEQHQPQYNPYGGGPAPYYGQPAQAGPVIPQRTSYPPQYGGYPVGPSTGGFAPTGHQSGPPTPPTGFPAYGQPQSSGPSTSVLPPQSPQPTPTDSAPPPS